MRDGLPVSWDEAWEGWIRPLLLILVLVSGVLAYRFDYWSEQQAGSVLCGVLLGVALLVPMRQDLLARPRPRAWLWLPRICWVALLVVAAGWPLWQAAHPPAPLQTLRLPAVGATAALDLPGDRAYSLSISSELPPKRKHGPVREIEAKYEVELSRGGETLRLPGMLSRKNVQAPGRGGGGKTLLRERRVRMHRIDAGAALTGLRLVKVDEILSTGLELSLRPARPHSEWFLPLAPPLLLLALILDLLRRDGAGKARTRYLPASGFALLFAWHVGRSGGPEDLVPPALGAAAIGTFIGVAAGFVTLVLVTRLLPVRAGDQGAEKGAAGATSRQ